MDVKHPHTRHRVAVHEVTDTRFWAVDKVILGYFLLTGLVVLGWWKTLPEAPGLLTWHILGSALIVLEVKRPNPTSWLFRNWYPLPYVDTFTKKWPS